MSTEAGSSDLYRDVDDVVSSELAVDIWKKRLAAVGGPPISCA